MKPLSLYILYIPDIATLGAGSARVVVGVGETSKGQLAHRAALALAERLGTVPVSFPGDHGGYGSHPAAFAVAFSKSIRRWSVVWSSRNCTGSAPTAAAASLINPSSAKFCWR